MTVSARSTRGRTRLTRWLLAAYAAGLLLVGPPALSVSGNGISADRLTELFNRYGDTSGRWSGADRTASVRLPDGRLLWLFSDTFLGPVNPDGSRPHTAPFINNSAVIQQGDELRETVHGGSPIAPVSLVPSDDGDQFHWIGDAHVVDSTLQVLVNRYRRTGAGPFDHTLLGTALATFDLPGLTPTGVRPLPVGARVSWGSELLTEGGHTYVYGTEAAGQLKFAHLARVAGTDLTAPWEFWTGAGWSPTEGSSARLLSGVGTSYGVQRVNGRYVLVTHENNVVFSSDVVAYTANSPTGPFQGPDHLFRAPETGDGHLVYDVDLHPDLARSGRLLASYNVNNVDEAVTYADAGVYRPRFIEVDWPRRASDRADRPPAPQALTAVAESAGNAELRWREPRTDDEPTYQVHRRDVTAGQTHFARLGGTVDEPRYSSNFLVNGHDYEFRVTTVDDRGESRPSETVQVTATVPPPPAPEGVRAVAGTAGDVSLHWNPIPFVQLHRIYQRNLTTGQRDRTLVGSYTGTSATVIGLRHGQTYEFTVVAVGGGGDSPHSAPARATAVVPPPTAPTGLSVTARPDGTARLTWASLGPYVSYRVYRRDVTAGETRLGRPSFPDKRTSFTADHLTHDHEYEFAVTAVNGSGESEESYRVRVRAQYATPSGTPKDLKAEAGPGKVKLTWQSTNPGGWHRIYRRDLTAREKEFTVEKVPVQGNEATIALLQNGHEYEFAVAALNQGGSGPLSEPVRVTPELPVPTGLAVTVTGSGTAALTWDPAGPGIFYRVYLRDTTSGGQWRVDPYPATGTRFTATLLTRGHRYEFRITAADGETESDPSRTVDAVIR